MAGLSATASILAACGGGAQRAPTAAPAKEEEVQAEPTAAPQEEAPVAEAPAEEAPAAEAPMSEEEAQAQAEIVAKDVMEFVLSSDEWPGLFGSVTFKLHEAFLQ